MTHTQSSTMVKAVLAINSGAQSVDNVAKAFGVDRATVYRWVAKHKETGSLDRHSNPASGRQPKIAGKQAQRLIKMLTKPASQYGFETDFWTTRRLVQLARREMGIKLSRMAVHRMLTRFEQSYRKPEIRYYEADSEKQVEWRNATVPKIRTAIKQHRAILYFEDESCIRLTPVVAKTWGKIGQKIIQKTTGNRGSVAAISAISNSGRLLFNVYSGGKRFCSKDIIKFLSEMLKHHPNRHLVVIMDQAPCHKSKVVTAYIASQRRLHVFYLPPRSPEFNPDEKVWRHLKHEELKSHSAKNTKELHRPAKRKLRGKARNKTQLMGIYRQSEGAAFFD